MIGNDKDEKDTLERIVSPAPEIAPRKIMLERYYRRCTTINMQATSISNCVIYPIKPYSIHTLKLEM